MMTGDEDHPISNQLLSGGDRLLGIAEIVGRNKPDLLAEHATHGIEVGHCQLRASLHSLAEPGVLPRYRTCNPDQHLCPSGVTKPNPTARRVITKAKKRR